LAAAPDTHVVENDYMGGVEGTLKEPDVCRGNVEDQKTSIASSNAMASGVQTKIEVTSDSGTNTSTGYQQDTADEEPSKAKFEREIRKSDITQDKSPNEAL
jgi:hypothetical protein